MLPQSVSSLASAPKNRHAKFDEALSRSSQGYKQSFEQRGGNDGKALDLDPSERKKLCLNLGREQPAYNR